MPKRSNDKNTFSAWQVVSSLSSIVFAKENRPNLIGAAVLTSINAALSYVTPYLLGKTVEALNQEDNASISNTDVSTTTLTFMLIGAYTLSQVIPNIRNQILAPVQASNTKTLLEQITEHQLNKSLDYFSKTPMSSQTYLINKGFVASYSIGNLITYITPSLIEISMSIGLLANRYGSGTGLGIAGIILASGALTVASNSTLMKARKAQIDTSSITWHKIDNALEQYKNIRDFNKYEHTIQAIENACKNAAQAEIASITTPLKIGLKQIAIPRIAMLAAALCAISGLQSTKPNPQEFLILLTNLNQLSSLLPNLSSALNDVFMSYPDLKFIFHELSNKSNQIHDTNTKSLKINESAPSIRFENVSFAYPSLNNEAPRVLFQDLSLEIEGGKLVAFISKSGAGKSSIFKLLYGYNKPISGDIYINDQNIDDINLKSLQSQICIIDQTPNLFNGSVRENIVYGSPNPDTVTDAQIWDFANMLQISDFLRSLEKGLDTPVGEHGKQLSGGEQQRVSILRGLFKPAAIRLLDEITSSLDSITASKIINGINQITRDETKILITHKLSEAQFADTIYVIDNKRIQAKGNHAHLLETCDLYKSLWLEQNKKSSAFFDSVHAEKSENINFTNTNKHKSI